MLLVKRDNARISARETPISGCGREARPIRHITFLSYWSFLFVIWGILQYGVTVFRAKISGEPGKDYSYILLAEGYAIALSICFRSRTMFLAHSAYYAFRVANGIEDLVYYSDSTYYLTENDDYLKTLDWLKHFLDLFSNLFCIINFFVFSIIAQC